MSDKKFPQSELPIRKSSELLPVVFQTDTNDKFMSAVVDPLIQPGVLQKTVGYVGRRYGKTFKGSDVYLDTDNTLRSRYQLEPGVVSRASSNDLTPNHDEIVSFYDYLDFKNQLKFFGNTDDRDDKITAQEHFTWEPPVKWDKFINYREYYWEPSGPPPVAVYGQSASIISTYRVSLGLTSYIFTPDGYSNNPTLTLYRGQTYKFIVNAPKEGFVIRTNYDTGSLRYDPLVAYPAGSIVVFDEKLWKAKVEIIAGDGSSITPDSQDWEFLELISTGNAIDYNNGITNNGIENGTLTFTVPYDSPDILFYQSIIDPNRFGRILISNIESNTKINIDKEVLGKTNYTSSNGVVFTNGLVVEFLGLVFPSKYATDTWLIEGVGKEITLTRFADLVVPVITTDVPEVLFDNEGFDTQPFDDATAYPSQKDYITISRDSIDTNPWSRYNRWFHRSVLEYAYSFRGQDFTATEASRAKRPIIEFLPNLQLYNHGGIAKSVVDYVDSTTTDIFSKIEGSTSYNIDGEFIFEGARILVTADTDNLANNKIYTVAFILHNGKKQITLRETDDTDSLAGQGVLIRRGTVNGGLMYHFNGTAWIQSQKKTTVNQIPLFDAFDENGVSFSNTDTYPVSTFAGTSLFSYKKGTSILDPELGFSLSYLNIDNVGDILFDWKWDAETFYYTINQTVQTKKLSTGFYKFNPNDSYKNGWVKLNNAYIQPIIDSIKITATTAAVTLTTVDWDQVELDPTYKINFYLNGEKTALTYTRNGNVFTFSKSFVENDIVSVKVIGEVAPVTGYYEIPVGLEKNPLNQDLTSFTLGQTIDHVKTSLEFDSRFAGTLPGISNLRDISDYQVHAKRFLKHSGLAPLTFTLLCDKTSNVIKSIQYAKKSYTEFKNNFLTKSIELTYNDNVADFVDDIISDITKTKTSASPWSDSDMIGSGAFTSIVYNVEDPGITTYTLSTKFSLTELSKKAVYVYINESQLLHGKEYQFNSTFGFVTVLKELFEGDVVEVREYVSTSFNHIPPTPTSMGLYKKYTPMIFVDDTYREPKKVIQGHDGSITVAYNDFRDDLLLELEYRIYNNIKQEYDTSVFDIDNTVGGYYSSSLYKKSDLDNIVSQEFLKWIQNTNINYTINEYFIDTESFTYTYSNMVDPTLKQNLPGYWRGVYQWFYDTDRPHRCPWEMLGFSEMPTWWETQYGAAPYTSGNLLLWEDLRDGIIRQGPTAGVYNRYKRSTLMSHIPVDIDGNLLSPLDSGLAGNFTLANNRGSFVLGDIGPAEYAWRSSSEWPFAVTMAMCLLKPFEYITESFDRSKTTLNSIGQTVNVDTGTFSILTDIKIPGVETELATGLVQYLSGYIKSRGLTVDYISNKIQNLDVNLSTRLSGFVDKAQQKYLLDSKNPKSSSSSIFIPPENYDIIFNVSAPITSVSYSGVIVEKIEGGWVINGYDDIHPYFNYYEAMASQRDPLITVGGVSETFTNWEASKTFNNGAVVKYKDSFYRALKTHTSTDNFESAAWKKLPKLPTVGGVEAYRRRNFNKLKLLQVSYGNQFNTIQDVVDFLLGYEEYLKSIGFVFNRYDPINKVSQDWASSAKEFMFWTKHGWAIGSLITLSPAAEKIDVAVPVGVADSILDGFYDYQILKGDGKPLAPAFVNINRTFQNITVEPTNTTEGIYYIKLYYVLKENVAIFSDKTVFSDIIYDKTTGYRQERIKTQGYRTVDWDGDYTSPGFLFDNVNIQVWQPYTDYRLGDIVAYRSYYWTSQVNQPGVEIFDNTLWTKLDSTPQKQLISNFDYKINQFEDYYNVSSEGIGESERALARHALGYQQRDYLQNLAEDSVSQFQLYQGFIREKGTSNAITKVFNKLSRNSSAAVELNEEWAFRIGRLGGLDQLTEIEFNLYKDKFTINPQSLLLVNSSPANIVDQHYRIPKVDFTIQPIPFTTSVSGLSLEAEPTATAGYVNINHVDTIVKTKDDILTLDINLLEENSHVWVTFESISWTVLRYNKSQLLRVLDATKSGTSVTITLNRRHSLLVDDIVGIKNVENLTGFFKITEIGIETITVAVDTAALDPVVESSTVINLYIFTPARFDTFDNLDEQSTALLANNSKLWIDNNGSDLWEVVQKQKQYTSKSLIEYGSTSPLGTGTAVLYNNTSKQIFSSMPGAGYVMVYLETDSGLILKQIIAPPVGFETNVIGSFGKKMAQSHDGAFLVIASPMADAISNNYTGEYDPSASYTIDEIVLYAGKLYKAINNVSGDGSSIDVYSEDWEPVSNIPALVSGSSPGFTGQGMISIYKYNNQQWEIDNSFVSPRPANAEFFGSDVAIGKTGSTYYLAVSAVGSLDNRGRVYLYTNTGAGWNHLENQNYKGIYNPAGFTLYPAGSIVWYSGSLWESLVDQSGDGSTIYLEDITLWKKLDPVSTQCSLPTNVALDDDGSTLALGLLSDTQLAELIKIGDQFGHSLTMSIDGSILAVGAPNSDGQYFANYRGIWRPDLEYVENDVVKYQNVYHRLVQRINEEDWSTTRSFNEEPVGLPWQEVGDSTTEASGKVYIYQRSEFGNYELQQTITSGSLSSISAPGVIENISTGDQFGWALDLDYSGSTLVVSSPRADVNFQNQGSAYVFSTDGYAPVDYKLTQKLESFEIYPNEYFGQSICISANTEQIIIGAKNTPFAIYTRFDATSGTTFDEGRTTFADTKGYAGAVYVFEKRAAKYYLVEKLEAALSPFESFGYSVQCTDSYIIVGSPDYVEPVVVDSVFTYPGSKVGTIRLFKKEADVKSLETLITQQPVVDIGKIKSIALYDNVLDIKIQDIDYVDHSKFKILTNAEQELKFKTPYDPAVYSIGTEDQIVDQTTAWGKKNVGQLWWNISTAKWLYSEQQNLSYRLGNWNTLAEGASIDVYEWIETPLLPSEWAALADTNEGLAESISGQPLYPNDDVYTIKELYNTTSGTLTETLYYYWVKNTVILPKGIPGRRIPCAEVSSLITNPSNSGNAFIALIDSDKFLAYNFKSVMTSDTALLNIQYLKNNRDLNAIHNEYQLLTEGTEDYPAAKLEKKWIDSIVGTDIAGNRIPDPKLPAKQRYGLEVRPRQSMFIDRLPALKILVNNVNEILTLDAFADTISFENLSAVDNAPSSVLNLYDVAVDTYEDLITVGTVRTRQAKLQANIVDGEIDTIDIVDPGFGYKPKELFNQEIPGVYIGPPIQIDGTGTGAAARCHIDGQGRIITVVVSARGKKYSMASATIRQFSVLVNVDSTANNYWSIYAWDDVRKVFFRSASQAYDTTKYWNYLDWWEAGYNVGSRIVKEIVDVSQEPTISVSIGDLIRVKEYANGGWAVFEKIANNNSYFLDNWKLVGRENGTIQLSNSLYDSVLSGIGYGNTDQPFDTGFYDIENSRELRNILTAIKENILIGEYASEWNKLFFNSIRYAFSEQQYIDWAFKTSFLNAVHNVGSFEQKTNYKNDNLTSFQDYINEVKPYRTTVREYVSRYDSLEPVGSAISDFDLPPTYSTVVGQTTAVGKDNPLLDQYPWKWWTDNNGYSITSIEIANGGANYVQPPSVLIEGNGTGATAKAYISNGTVSGIKVTNPGSGYTYAPKITLVGGNASGQNSAIALAVIGDTKARTFNVGIKFDRISKVGLYTSFVQSQTFVATGYSAVFELNYAPTRDKSKILIYKNDQLVLNNEYTISLYKSSTDTFGLLRGKIIFNIAPLGPDVANGRAADVIEVTYEKNDELLDSVNRIQKYYSPGVGMKGLPDVFNESGLVIGKDYSQLMTGIDFGGVQIQGTTFEVTGGWDALPWFTDSWDSVESSSDYYVVCDGSTNLITLPYVPAAGQQITVYLKRVGSATSRNINTLGEANAPVVSVIEATDGPKTIRIDDPFFNDQVDSSTSINPNAQMPTFIGDGVTNTVDVGNYVSTEVGDILIFRPIESDGAVVINDPNLLDTQLSGGSLAAMSGAYATATGTSAEDISIDGGNFVQPEHVPATEENVPGQVLDSVSIKCYTSPISGAAPLQSKIVVSNGTTKLFNIGLNVLESKSVLVYVDKVKRELGSASLDYSIDLTTHQIEFVTAPTINSIIEIISVGIGGLELLDYQEFVADGETELFLTSANYLDTNTIFVTVDGQSTDVGFIDSTGVVDTPGKALIQFATKPAKRAIIKIVCLGVNSDVDSSGLSIVRVNQQTFEFEGSTRSFDLSNFVELQRSSALSSMVVEVNNRALVGVDTTYFVYDGTTTQFLLGVDPEEPAGTILPSNIKVFVNNELKTFIQDYSYDGTTKNLILESSVLTLGDVIKIENNFRAEYSITGNNIIIDSSVDLTSVNETDNDLVTVTWFSEYPSMNIVSDEFTGGKVNYNLANTPLNVSYVWVYKNGQRLTQDQDYYISLPRNVIYLTNQSTVEDSIKIVLFGANIYKLPSAFEIHKDMLNVFYYKRYATSTVTLSQPLYYYDQQITVTDASELTEPIESRNIPGIVSINGERIEYMRKNGNVLSQLRRGSFGTPIGTVYEIGSAIADIGIQETIPYNESQERTDFVSDGSTLLVGLLDYVPLKSTRANWYRSSIPSTYGPCDQIEVFVGGKRLRKDPLQVYSESRGSASPAADIQLEAEFSVDGSTGYIRLTNPAAAGTRISVIKRTGKLWYARGDTTASSGITLLKNNTAITNFIAEKTTKLPE
jgi:hypothetical protein